MWRLSILSCLALIALQPAIAGAPEEKSRAGSSVFTLYLFGASWCAPCVAELRDIRKLAAAASPDRIVIVWGDAGLSRFPLPKIANVEVSRDRERLDAAAALGRAGSAGLPYVSMVDSRGRKCAELRARLTPEAIERMRGECRT